MTVEEMIAERTEKLEAIKDSSNAAVTAKGGTAADDLSGLPAAIASIPSGGELPELTDPATAGDVIAGKEYIDGNGEKKSGTLVVCDTVYEVETLPYPGTGLTVDLESTVDGSSKTLTLPEPNLAAENIVVGSSIFGVPGTAKKLRVETGTITPAEDITAIDIACTAGYRLFVLKLTSGAASGKAHWNDIYCTPDISASATQGSRNANAHYVDANGKVQAGILSASADTGFKFDVSGIFAAAGCTYTWTAYYWEDDA